MPQRGVRLVGLLLVVAGLLAAVPVATPQEHDPAPLRIAAEDEGCPGDRTICLIVLDGDPRQLSPGEEDVTVVFENRAARTHTLFVGRLSDADPHRATDGGHAVETTGPHGVAPGEHAQLSLDVPEDAEGIYLWCDRQGHEAAGMWIEAPFTQDAIEAAQGPLDGTTGQVLGAAGVLGLLAAAWVYRDRLWPWLVGLYTRLTKREILEHEDRQAILALVEDRPGIHFRDIARRLDLGHGILDHHLRKLTEAGVLEEHATESHRCYFPTGRIPASEREALANVKAGSARRLMAALREHPGSSLSELAEAVGLARSTVSHHIARLEDVRVVDAHREGRAKALRLTDLGEEVLDRVEAQETTTGPDPSSPTDTRRAAGDP